MTHTEIFLAIAVMASANLLTRVLPFIFFVKKTPPEWIVFIEKSFPPIIMTILIFYTLSHIEFENELYGFKELSAIFITAFLHIKLNNYLISICVGTVSYMGLVQFF